MELLTWVQTLHKVVCISLCANTLQRGMNPSQLWINSQTFGSLALVRQPVKEKENSEFKSALLHLKIDLENILLGIDCSVK